MNLTVLFHYAVFMLTAMLTGLFILHDVAWWLAPALSALGVAWAHWVGGRN